MGNGEVRRQRVCVECGEPFSTTERISAHDIVVVKRGDRPRERFSRTKLRRGIEKSAGVWTITPADLDAFVQRIVTRIRPTPGVPVSSASIGELVLRVLEGDDPMTSIARIRFAIVFRGRSGRSTHFRGLDDFLAWMGSEYGTPSSMPSQGTSRVVKRDGRTEPFEIKRLERSIGIAAKGRDADSGVERMATNVAQEAVKHLEGQAIVTSQQLAAHVLEILARTDQLAYLRYASAVKRYRSIDDFWTEALALRAVGSAEA